MLLCTLAEICKVLTGTVVSSFISDVGASVQLPNQACSWKYYGERVQWMHKN